MKIRRSIRFCILGLLAASLGACHFHGGHCGGWGFHYCAPVRHCR